MKFGVIIASILCVFLMFSGSVVAQEEFGTNENGELIDEEIYDFEPYELDELEEKITQALEDEDSEMFYRIGRMYEEGHGVKIDAMIASQWYEKSAELGFIPAMLDLGELYLFGGEGLYPNPTKSLSWLRKAEATKQPMALYKLGMYYENVNGINQSFPKAFDYYKRAAKKDILNAHVKLANYYQYGAEGVDVDIQMSIRHFKLLRDLAKRENVTLFVNTILANLYAAIAKQQDVPEKRFQWTLIAAQEKHIQSMVDVGNMYLHGFGVAKDYEKSVAWFLKAEEFENADAIKNLGYMYMHGFGVDKDYKEALGKFERAAELGDSLAAWNVGNIYHNGYGVSRDLTTAKTWFDRSEGLKRKERFSQ